MERSLLSSDARGKGLLVGAFNTDDHISRLSNDLLLKILSRLHTNEAVRTSILSKRWIHVWKERSALFLDMRQISTALSEVTPYASTSITKVINDHRGHLERCAIYHYSYLQCEDGTVESWIWSLVHEKQTKNLTLVNSIGRFTIITKSSITLDLHSESFSHPSLTSLHLGGYNLKAAHGFKNCWSLKKLKLIGISADIGVFNALLLSCSSLELLVLIIMCHKKNGPLKIENRSLRFLSLSCNKVDGVEVASPNLEILTVGSLSCEMEKFLIGNPRLHFNRSYWATGMFYPHTSYDLVCPHQETKSSGHEFMMNESREYMQRFASMSVSVDLKNIKEVDMLKEMLVAWPEEMAEFEIVFKNNNASMEEGECSNGGTQKKFWEETKPFPNAYFRAYTVWLFNFSGSKEEFALASCFITQGTVVRTMMIKPTSVSQINKLKIEEAVAKLKELPKGHEELKIVMF